MCSLPNRYMRKIKKTKHKNALNVLNEWRARLLEVKRKTLQVASLGWWIVFPDNY